MYTSISIDIVETSIIITIERPKALNAINAGVMGELGQFFNEGYKAYPDARGVIITGSGEKSFAAGADISEFSTMDAAAGSDKSRFGHNVYNAIENFHLPVIAAVNGFALGGGCELAMACHLRVAGEKARFGMPEVNLGLIPGYGGTQRLVQLVGKSKALELMMTADMVSADEALGYGLANSVVPAGLEVESAIQIIQKISQKGPLAIKGVIASVNACFDKNVDGFAFESDLFGKLIASEDGKEGAAAFFEKRTANFTGK